MTVSVTTPLKVTRDRTPKSGLCAYTTKDQSSFMCRAKADRTYLLGAVDAADQLASPPVER